jgi:hypothetical protein
MAYLSNPNTKLKALHDTSMDKPYQSKRIIIIIIKNIKSIERENS